MKRFLITFVILVLMISSVFTQERFKNTTRQQQSWKLDSLLNNLPTKIYWDNDTVIVITPYYLKLTNLMLAERNYLKEVNKELSGYRVKADSLILNKNLQLKSYVEQIEYYKQLDGNAQEVQKTQATEIKNLNKELRKQKRQKNIIGLTGIIIILTLSLVK